MNVYKNNTSKYQKKNTGRIQNFIIQVVIIQVVNLIRKLLVSRTYNNFIIVCEN